MGHYAQCTFACVLMEPESLVGRQGVHNTKSLGQCLFYFLPFTFQFNVIGEVKWQPTCRLILGKE